MPQITAIKPQVKRQGRYNIFIDGKYRLALSELGLVSAGIRVGQDLTSEELDALEQTSSYAKAMERAQYFLSFRPRSRAEMLRYLTKKDYDVELIEKIISELEGQKLIDDEAFAVAWVQSRNLVKHRSQRILRQELIQKGISRDIIDTALVDGDNNQERANLREITQKKMNHSAYADRSKLMRYLASKGFNYSDIKSVLEELGSEDYLNSYTDNDNP